MKKTYESFLLLQRSHSSDTVGTYGHLCFGLDTTLCTLEPSVPVIPVGIYDLCITRSPRFGVRKPYCSYKGVPLVNKVPGHSGIRIHIGNYVSDTDGCILVGLGFTGVRLTNSVDAYRRLMNYLSNDYSAHYKIFVGDESNPAFSLYVDYIKSQGYEEEEDLPF